MFTDSVAPQNWTFCDGKLLWISDYPLLFSILGTDYGGDGIVTFGIPDLNSAALLPKKTPLIGFIIALRGRPPAQ